MFAASLFLGLPVLSSVLPIQASGPNPNQVYVAGISYGGTGCPANTVSISMAQDQQSFTLIFDQFVATSGAGTTAKEHRKNCQVNIDMRYPQGYSYSVTTVDYRGFVGIPAGLNAIQRTNYYFAGQTEQIDSKSIFTGPFNQNYLIRDTIDVSQKVWSPCGSVVRGNVNAEVRLQGDVTKTGQITVDSIDGKVQQTFGISWKTC
ncbi:hypothetical protein BC833DRAFT_617477 [Globomyces pollinis-pini]|nr:hypothetical protein BC833DRAFT_617477 [Globomyces pollinis-pini]KAJ2996663.1 hypothetical protein HDV02_006301 [Globomyces sp. JEL0801]